MELKDIYELWNRFDSSATVELELTLDGAHLHLRKTETAPPAKNAVGSDPLAKMAEKEPENDGGSVPPAEIRSPLAGTFYRRPSPDAAPFVEIGSEVHKGDVIGIIEAMKLMNEVTADADGIVTEIPVEDGTLVEYHQVLIRLQER